MNRAALVDVLDQLVPQHFPIEGGGQTLAAPWHGLGSFLMGNVTPIAPPAPGDALGAVLCQRRGVTYGATYAIAQWVQLAGTTHLETTVMFEVPLVTPDGWMIVDGRAYDATALVGEIAERVPSWLARCAASTRLQMPSFPVDEPWHVYFDARGSSRVFTPTISPPITPRSHAIAEYDGTVVALACGGVLVWPADDNPSDVRAYLALDDEEPCAAGPVRRGTPLFTKVRRDVHTIDARDPIDVLVTAGDAVCAGTLLARADGRDVPCTSAGRVTRVEVHAVDPASMVAEIIAAARPPMEAAFVERMVRMVTGRITPYRIVDDHGVTILPKGAELRFEQPPTLREISTIIECLDDDGVYRMWEDFRDSLDRVPALEPPAWLDLRLRDGIRHRVRVLVAPEAA
ncbi:MAG TPA: hypothetical protein VIV11_02700 [Kofleriaceae bacterium]